MKKRIAFAMVLSLALNTDTVSMAKPIVSTKQEVTAKAESKKNHKNRR